MAHLIWRYRARAFEAARAFQELSPGVADPHVLDLGAADGLTLLELRKLLGGRGQYDGVELSETLLGEAPLLPSNVRLVQGDVAKLPPEISAGSYQLVTCLAVLEHLPSPELCIREAYRALAPGGVFVTSCPNPFWDEVAGALRLVQDEHHQQHLSGKNLVQALTDEGFENVVYRPFMWAPVGLLPYFKLMVPLWASHQVDERVRRLRFADFAFVNQLVFGRRPR